MQRETTNYRRKNLPIFAVLANFQILKNVILVFNYGNLRMLNGTNHELG